MAEKLTTKTFTFALIILVTFLGFTFQIKPAMAHCEVGLDLPCGDACGDDGDEEATEGETCEEGGRCRSERLGGELICTLDEADAVVRVDFGTECRLEEEGRSCGPEGETNLGTCEREAAGSAAIRCNPPSGTATDKDKDKDETPATLKPRPLANPLGTSSVAEIIARLISIITGVSGSIALLVFVYGGIQWLIAGGEPGKIEAGRKAMVWAVVGLIIIFGSYAILSFLFRTIGASSLL